MKTLMLRASMAIYGEKERKFKCILVVVGCMQKFRMIGKYTQALKDYKFT